MRSLLARLAVLGTFALTMTACSNGAGNSLPFAGPPNNAGGVPGTIQSGGNGLALLRFIQGSPDTFSTFGGPPASGTVDVCVDNLPLNITAPSVSYGAVSGLYSVPGGIAHTIAVYPTLGGANVGLECPTAPGPYLGTNTIKVTTVTPGLAPAANVRLTIVLGGSGGARNLFVFGEPSFPIAPGGPEVISHNAAPTFTATTATKGVGFGLCTTTVTPCTVPTALAGAQNRPAPTAATVSGATINGVVISAIAVPPAGFFDGAGVNAGTPVPITSIAAPNPVAGQPYVVELYCN